MSDDQQFLKSLNIQPCNIQEPHPLLYEVDEIEVEQIGDMVIMARATFDSVMLENRKAFEVNAQLQASAETWCKVAAESDKVARRLWWLVSAAYVALLFSVIRWLL